MTTRPIPRRRHMFTGNVLQRVAHAPRPHLPRCPPPPLSDVAGPCVYRAVSLADQVAPIPNKGRLWTTVLQPRNKEEEPAVSPQKIERFLASNKSSGDLQSLGLSFYGYPLLPGPSLSCSIPSADEPRDSKAQPHELSYFTVLAL